jgi:hypothetical protein
MVMNANRMKTVTGLAAALSLGMGLLSNAPQAQAAHNRNVHVSVATPQASIAFHRGRSFGVAPCPTTVCENRPRQVWREPIYETRQVWVEIPAVTETRRVARYAYSGRLIGYDHVEVVIVPARRVLRTEQVLVRPGYFETVYERVCHTPQPVRPGFGVGFERYDHRSAPARAIRVGFRR